MAIPKEHSHRYFYHFTHLDNLDSILKHGLLCTRRKEELGLAHTNVASEGIQERRRAMEVTCGPKGNIHDYVPFYMCTRNPMLLSVVNSKNVDQQFIIFLKLPLDRILGKDVVFTDASANTAIPPHFFDSPACLSNLDWAAIDSLRWSCESDDERHRRMAEVLIYDTVKITEISHIVVWNDSFQAKVEKTFKKYGIDPPRITTDSRHHFTKFMIRGRDNESLITGPYFLKQTFKSIVSKTMKKRKENEGDQRDFKFKSISQAVKKIKKDFCIIPELEGIFELETINAEHSENVSDHTLTVVKNLEKLEGFNNLPKADKDILVLAGYLHDIGKGPASKWKTGRQPAYPDHPVDGLIMMERILIEDFEEVSEDEITILCMLVAYHDLIGEIIGKGRDIHQLIDIIKTERQLTLLSLLNEADVAAINEEWLMNYWLEVDSVLDKVRQSFKR
jgi:putative nucleotidyltransferase with HDIG domain